MLSIKIWDIFVMLFDVLKATASGASGITRRVSKGVASTTPEPNIATSTT
jgi:hypothetical protein